jgi:hypothetical protein
MLLGCVHEEAAAAVDLSRVASIVGYKGGIGGTASLGGGQRVGGGHPFLGKRVGGGYHFFQLRRSFFAS